MIARTVALAAAAASLALASLASLGGCAVDANADPVDETMTGSDAVTKCTKKVYVHVVSYGYTDYASMFGEKNGCWGLEAPKWSSGAKWSDCHATTPIPSGGTRWTYDDINIGAAGHADATKILACKKANGGDPDIAYVAANSGSGWSRSGITGVERFFNECYDTDFAVHNRLSGCTSNGAHPMWNIGASSEPYKDTLALCKSVSKGSWIGIYGATVGLKGKESAIVKALNYCTTH